MTLKIILVIMLLLCLAMLYGSFVKPHQVAETPIDKIWWDGLGEEWRTIFLINQNFQKQHVDIYKIQNEYMNRLNAKGEAGYSPLNSSLNDLNDGLEFGLGYDGFYARALRTNHVRQNDSIDLNTLSELETIYMVNGPGDLAPLKKFPHLKVLVINYCGIDNNLPLAKQLLNLEALRNLQELKVLHCTSNVLYSLEPLKNLVNLEELYCNKSSVTSLSPLKNLHKLRILSFGSKVNKTSAIEGLTNMEALYLKVNKGLPDLSKMKKLQKLAISESEMAIVDARYRTNSIDFLKDLPDLQFLDLQNTSYRGSLAVLNQLGNLEAVTLPLVSRSEVADFKDLNKKCIIINSYEYE